MKSKYRDSFKTLDFDKSLDDCLADDLQKLSQPSKIRVYYSKAVNYETIYADGALIAGGEDGKGSIKFDFFASHYDLFEEIWHNKPVDKPDVPDFKDELKLNRELRIRVGMSLENATRIYEILGATIANMKNAEETKK